jgi:DNA replication protein DnaC
MLEAIHVREWRFPRFCFRAVPFDPEAANLMFSLFSARYERASMIVTSIRPFSAWGEIFGDEV